jgi:S-DNA-T family DNA segregation ATPase FtsK/SpoIIIE
VSTTLDTTKFTKASPLAAVTPSDIEAVQDDVVKPSPARSGSAAMVVAKTTGRGLGTGTRHLTKGIGGTGSAVWRYLRATDRVESVQPSSPTDWHHIKEERRRRWAVAGATASGGGLVAVIGGWIGMVAGAGLTALPGLEAGLSAEGATAAVAAAIYGRRLQRRAELEAAPVHEAIEVGPGVVLDLDGDPFPLAQCHSADQVRVCVWRALKAEGVPVAEVYDIVRQQWGWQCVVRVSEGTPEAIIAKAGALETRFDLPTNGLRPQPTVERRACAILRLVQGDPFATAPGLPYRAPKSMSITDRFRVGTSVGGDPLELSLAGVMGLWVAASGGGKTGILQALAEGTTACRDNITIDLDPHGDGLEDLHDAVRITARTHQQIESVLLFFLVMSKARARLRKKLGMGKKWIASPKHPAVTLFFDEFPKGTELAKRLAFDLLLVGRKELIDLEIASQGGTKLYLGENIAQMIAMKGVGPCKVGDTRAVFGDGAVAEGWLPHKLSPATDTDPKDAGHIFIQGVPGMSDEPIEYKVHETVPATMRMLAAERQEAGLVEPDRDSLDAMRGVDLPEYVEPEYDNDGNLKKEAPVHLLTWDQLLRLCDAEPAAGATPSLATAALADSVDLMDKFGVDRMRTETLAAALADHDPGAYGDLTPEALRSLLADAGAGKPVTLGSLDGLANPRGFKRDQLAAYL